jgi:WD40 repeat protein
MLQTLKGHTNGVLAVTFLLDSKQVASALTDSTVQFWDAAIGVTL